MYNCIIIDNDTVTSNLLKMYIEKTEGLVLEGLFTSVSESSSHIENHWVDLLFIDFEQFLLSGIDLFKQISSSCKIVFTSYKESYAYLAFEYMTVDFLLKPISEKDFQKTVTKLKILTSPIDSFEKANKQQLHKNMIVRSGLKNGI